MLDYNLETHFYWISELDTEKWKTPRSTDWFPNLCMSWVLHDLSSSISGANLNVDIKCRLNKKGWTLGLVFLSLRRRRRGCHSSFLRRISVMKNPRKFQTKYKLSTRKSVPVIYSLFSHCFESSSFKQVREPRVKSPNWLVPPFEIRVCDVCGHPTLCILYGD